MTKVNAQQCEVDVYANFAPPMLDWSGVPGRYFGLIHDALSEDFQVNAKDFSDRTDVSPGTSEAVYRGLGGQSEITLSANRLSARFSRLRAGDIEAVLKIMEAVDRHFGQIFPNYSIHSIRCALNAHALVLDGASVDRFLEPYRNPKIDSVLSRLGEVSYGPSIKFSARSQHGDWTLFCVAEQSEVLVDGLFLGLDMTLPVTPATDSFANRLRRVSYLLNLCLEALEIEWCTS